MRYYVPPVFSINSYVGKIRLDVILKIVRIELTSSVQLSSGLKSIALFIYFHLIIYIRMYITGTNRT